MNWRPPSLSELIPVIFNIGVTHLGSEATIYLCEIVGNNMLVLVEQPGKNRIRFHDILLVYHLSDQMKGIETQLHPVVNPEHA